MSVTVEDALQLPSLRSAAVIGGSKGLKKIVSGISVLESADPKKLISDIFQSGEYLASELVITGFLDCATDVDLQCAVLRRLSEGGEVGLILFYVGVYMPKVDSRLIRLADELDFPLIQMPDNKSLRYGEVIREVSEYLYRDREQDIAIVSEILARITELPEHLRTVNVVLRMLGERLQATIVLTDLTFHILNLVSWPSGTEDTVRQHVDAMRRAAASQEMIAYPYAPKGLIYHTTIAPNASPAMRLFVIKEGLRLNPVQLEQAADVVRLGVNIWGQQHNAIVMSELIRAILQDDPIKMRRLADIFHVNIQEVHDIWTLYGDGDHYLEVLRAHQDELLDTLRSCADNVFCDFYDDRLFLFSSEPYELRTADTRLMKVLELIRSEDPSITMFFSGGLQTTTEVREAYLCYTTHLSDAKKIYPTRHRFTLGELEFAEECHNQIDRGEEVVRQILSRLTALQEKHFDWDVLHTLAVYLLDTECSMTASAELLHLHQNTIKYRINVIANTLGFRPGKIPDSMQLYRALAIDRLLQS